MQQTKKECAWYAKHSLIAAQSQILSADLILAHHSRYYSLTREKIAELQIKIDAVIQLLEPESNAKKGGEKIDGGERSTEERNNEAHQS